MTTTDCNTPGRKANAFFPGIFLFLGQSSGVWRVDAGGVFVGFPKKTPRLWEPRGWSKGSPSGYRATRWPGSGYFPQSSETSPACQGTKRYHVRGPRPVTPRWSADPARARRNSGA